MSRNHQSLWWTSVLPSLSAALFVLALLGACKVEEDDGPRLPPAPAPCNGLCLPSQICENNQCVERGTPSNNSNPDMGDMEDMTEDEESPDMDDMNDMPDADMDDTNDMPDTDMDDVEDMDVEEEPDMEERCTQDSDCPGLQICNLDSGECAADPNRCITSDDCAEGTFCNAGRCEEDRFECVDNLQCGAGSFCFVGQCEHPTCNSNADCAGTRRCQESTQICVDCLEDRHCPGNQTCDPLSGICQSAETCTNDEDCAGRFSCTDGTCSAPECIEDTLEPSNTPEQASELASLGETAVYACLNDEDWYTFQIPANSGFLARIAFDDSNNTILEANLFANNNFDVSVLDFFDTRREGLINVYRENVAEETTYHLRVVHAAGLVVPYTIDFSVQSGGFCLDDLLEPNDNQDEAQKLPKNTYAQGLRICGEDEDWYSVQLENGEVLSGVVDTLLGGIPGIEVTNPQGQRILRDSSDQSRKEFMISAEESGLYYLHLFSLDPSQTPSFDLELQTQ